MAEMNEIFSKNFQKFLERRGLTQTDIAEKMEVSNATISYWLSGTKTPRMDKLGRLAKILNTTIHALTEENGFEEYNRQLPSGLIDRDTYKRKLADLTQQLQTAREAPSRPSEPVSDRVREFLQGDVQTVYGRFTRAEKRRFWHMLLLGMKVDAGYQITDIVYTNVSN